MEEQLAAETGRPKADPVLAFTARFQQALAGSSFPPEFQLMMMGLLQSVHASTMLTQVPEAEAVSATDEPPSRAASPEMTVMHVDPQVQQVEAQQTRSSALSADQAELRAKAWVAHVQGALARHRHRRTAAPPPAAN